MEAQAPRLEVDIGSGDEGDYDAGAADGPQANSEPTHQELREEWAELERQASVLRSSGLPRGSPGYEAALDAAAKAKARWQAARPAKPLPLRLRNQRKQLARAEGNRSWWADEVARIEREYACRLEEARGQLRAAQEKESTEKEKMRRLRDEEYDGEDGDDGRANARGVVEAIGEAEELNRALAPQLEELAAMAEHHDDSHPQRLLINSVLSGFKGINSVFERARGARLQWADASLEEDDDDFDDDADDGGPTATRSVRPRHGATDVHGGLQQQAAGTGGAARAEQQHAGSEPSGDASAVAQAAAAAAERERTMQQLQLQNQQEAAQQQAHAQAQAAQAAAAAAAAVRAQAQSARAEAEASFPSELKSQLAEVVNTAQCVGVDFFEDLVQSGFTVQSINAKMLREYVRNKGWQ